MKSENVPLKEKFETLVKGLAELMSIAEELSRNPVHGQSPHIAPLVGRLRGGIESTGWHVKFLAELPEAAAPAAEVKPQPSTSASDAKAGATPAK